MWEKLGHKEFKKLSQGHKARSDTDFLKVQNHSKTSLTKQNESRARRVVAVWKKNGAGQAARLFPESFNSNISICVSLWNESGGTRVQLTDSVLKIQSRSQANIHTHDGKHQKKQV